MKIHHLLTGAGAVLAAASAQAVTLYGTTAGNQLIRFDSATPGTIASTLPITGLSEQTESIAGLDFRPATSQLYALGGTPAGNYRIYAINTATGVATQVGTDVQALAGSAWGFDFNPSVDRIRVFSNTGTNLRFHPDTGALVATDTSLSLTGVAAGAYDRNDTNPATPTTLFGISVTTSELVRIGGVDGNPSPNGGAVTAVGLLGTGQLSSFVSLDIYQDGTAYAALSTSPTAPVRGNPVTSGLYTVNLTTGAATLVGQIGNGLQLTGLAAIPEPGSAAVLGLGALLLGGRRRRQA